MDRTRRSGAGKRLLPTDALAAIRAARQGGTTRAQQVKLKDEGDVYEEVDEERYAELVNSRKGDSFVEDDGETGYADDGEENWDTTGLSEEQIKQHKMSKLARMAFNKRKADALVSGGPVSGVFLGGGRTLGPSMIGANKGAEVKAEDEDYLKTLMAGLNEAEEDGESAAEKAAKRRRDELSKVALFGGQANIDETLNQVYDEQFSTEMDSGDYMSDAAHSGSAARLAAKLSSMQSLVSRVDGDFSAPPPAKLQFDESGNYTLQNASLELDDDYLKSPTQTVSNAAGGIRVGVKAPPLLSAKDKNQLTAAEYAAARLSGDAVKPQPLATGLIASQPSAGMAKVSPVDKDNELQFYWYDAYEEPTNPSTIFLFGKALLPDRQSSGSCCIQVQNLERNVFVLPRKYKLSDPADESSVTETPVTMIDVYQELQLIMANAGVKQFKIKPDCERQYAFDRDMDPLQQSLPVSSLLDPVEGVPKQAKYLKLAYSFKDAALPRNLKGATFSRLFGTKTSAIELFLLKRELMGPQWLTISGVQSAPAPKSWCKFEYSIPSHKNIRITDPSIAPEPPLFSMLSLSVKSAADAKNKHEIVMISYLVHESVSIEGATTAENDVTSETLISKRASQALPVDLNPLVAKFNASSQGQPVNGRPRQNITLCASERALLNLFVAKLHSIDPDMIVSHDLHGEVINLLMNRMKEAKVPHWSKLGRLNKVVMPFTSNSGRLDDQFSLVDRGVGCGRLQLDTRICSQEFLSGQRDYTLTYLAESQLKLAREEVESSQVPQFFESGADMMKLVQLNQADALIAFGLMFKLMMVPLSKQLTNQCGNLWNRTLRSVRSERVEYLLLHNFHRLKYIIPEKYSHKERKAKQEKLEGKDNAEGEEGATGQAKKRRGKPQYSGGLVLEPKRGFYDKFILLLDFNSLYPSIIQEFNICFTTVKHWMVKSRQFAAPVGEEVSGEVELAALPETGISMGTLPTVIARLVERRREVKRLLKRETDPGRSKQLDIRQKALKLVANSLYGCLGFQNSRFYCEPLAALITSQGRDILQSSVDLTNALGANVIYGDTDSIMVNTNENNYERAIELGNKIKKEVNARRRVLEIDIDGVFKNMLLLRKKKYAALKIIDNPDGSGTKIAQREVKGLDLVRRDWCGLSKDVGDYVLSQILSGQPREEVVANIHTYLEQVRDQLKANQVPLEKFVITKGLTKAPKDYPDWKNQPHVKVALDLQAKGKTVRVGDFIPYVQCEGDPNLTQAQRAYHPSAVQQADGHLALDVKWYLSNQIMPPIARLCGPIEETDAGRLAHCLGLDPKSFQNFNSSAEQAAALEDDELLVSLHVDDEEKFKSAKEFFIKCDQCKQQFKFPGVFSFPPVGSDATLVPSGLQCPPCQGAAKCPGILPASVNNSDAAESLAFSRLSNSLLVDIRHAIQQYYFGWYRCNDSACQRRTRDLPLKGRSCTAPGCSGKLEKEISAAQLYLQLAYYQSLFDVQRAEEMLQAENRRRREAAAAHQAPGDALASVPQLVPDVPATHLRLYHRIYNFLMSILSTSNYHWLPPSIFYTSGTGSKVKRQQ